MSDSIKRLLSLLAVTVCVAVPAAGCGDDDNGGGGGGGGSDAQDVPKTRGEAIDRCYEEADKLEGQAKETARAACRSAETGDTDQVKEEAKQQCLDSAKQIPDPAARKQAEQACERFGK